jgi:hypothetical protein
MIRTLKTMFSFPPGKTGLFGGGFSGCLQFCLKLTNFHQQIPNMSSAHQLAAIMYMDMVWYTALMDKFVVVGICDAKKRLRFLC